MFVTHENLPAAGPRFSGKLGGLRLILAFAMKEQMWADRYGVVQADRDSAAL